MRIVLLAQRPQRRGAEVFAYQLTNELRRQGHVVRLVFLYPYEGGGALPHTLNQVLNGNEKSLLEKIPGIEPGLAQRLLQAIDELEPDVVQANGARTVKYGAFAAIARPSRKWVLIYRNIGNPRDWMRTPLHKVFYRYVVMRRLDGVVGVSNATLNVVRDYYSLPIPMMQIPRGIDPSTLVPTMPRQSLRSKVGTPPEAPVIVFVGSLAREKRLDRLLRMASSLKTVFPLLRIWLVGDGPSNNLLHQMASELDLQDSVTFFGVQDNVADYLNAADVFVLTSDTEGMPGVLLEAGYSGLPVVATDVGGVRECVIDGDTGIVVAQDDEDGLAHAVERLLRDDDLRSRMGELAHQWIAGRFTIDIVAGQYVEFYQSLLLVPYNIQAKKE